MTDSIILKAILAMDSYNRGYNASINLGNDPHAHIGNATIKLDSSVLGTTIVDGNIVNVDQSAGFYGIAYTLPSGETVISYRGTDDPTGLLSGSDILNGWVIGAGQVEDTQAGLAFQFYNAVATQITGGEIDPRLANISLTGHSLGGGLAGLVGDVYHKDGTLFDNMPFEQAADNVQILSDPALSLAAGKIYNPALEQLVYGNFT